MLLLLSASSRESDVVLCAMKRALRTNRPIGLVRIENVHRGQELKKLLRSERMINAFERPLAGWAGSLAKNVLELRYWSEAD